MLEHCCRITCNSNYSRIRVKAVTRKDKINVTMHISTNDVHMSQVHAYLFVVRCGV